MADRWGNSGNSVRLYFWGSKITADGDCSHEIKRLLLLGRKVMTNLDSIFKQQMARVNVDILGMSELKWTCMGKFNSDDHCIYYCGQESLGRNGVLSWSTKKSEMQYLDAISKTTE